MERYEIRWVEYHSDEWMEMVENHWITVFTEEVEGIRVAKMMRAKKMKIEVTHSKVQLEFYHPIFGYFNIATFSRKTNELCNLKKGDKFRFQGQDFIIDSINAIIHYSGNIFNILIIDPATKDYKE